MCPLLTFTYCGNFALVIFEIENLLQRISTLKEGQLVELYWRAISVTYVMIDPYLVTWATHVTPYRSLHTTARRGHIDAKHQSALCLPRLLLSKLKLQMLERP